MGREGKPLYRAVNMKRDLRSWIVCVVAVILCAGAGCGVMRRSGHGLEPTTGPQSLREGVRFSIFSTRVRSVAVAGTFNNWSMTADMLSDREGTGMWTIVLPLPPGRHEYKFVINGEEWIPDPGNSNLVDDGFGGSNSVILVEP